MSNSDRSVRTRNQLLDAAWDLMAERGAEVSMADIAAAAGITRQAVHHHVGSRSGLLTALVRRADERAAIAERLNRALGIPDPAGRLDACLSEWLRFVVEIRPVALELIRLRPVDPDAAAAWNDRMADLLALFGRLVASLAADGVLNRGLTETEATDLIWVTCSVQAWSLLVDDRGWSPAAASLTLRRSMASILLTAP